MKEQPMTLNVDQLYARLEVYIKYLAGKVNSNHILLQHDELMGELSCELVKGWLYYKDQQLPSEQLIPLIKRVLSNRLGELIYRFHVTYRKVESFVVDLDDINGEDGYGGGDPADVYDSSVRVDTFLSILTDDEYAAVTAILNGDPRVQYQMRLTAARRSWVYCDTVVKLSYVEISRALHFSRSYARSLWAGVIMKWKYSGGSELTKSDVARRFGKQRLLDIADELEMDIKSSTHIYQVIDAINANLDEEGIPEIDTYRDEDGNVIVIDDGVSDDLLDYLIAGRYVDENGDLIDEDEEKGGKTVELPDRLPRCWGQGESDDPACKRCPIKEPCAQQRIKIRPTCFGNGFDSNSSDCDMCREYRHCESASS